MLYNKHIVVVIPCYRVIPYIQQVIATLPDLVDQIICIDDGCPENSGQYIQTNCTDPRLIVLYNQKNMGVGAAVIHGWQYCIEHQLGDIIIKMDGDGQMDPQMMPQLIQPIAQELCQYAKGNRFFNATSTKGMPLIRRVGNRALTVLCHWSSGYWELKDSTNGYLAIPTATLRKLPRQMLSQGYFFETDLICHLAQQKAIIAEIAMPARYGQEKSNINLLEVIPLFLYQHLLRFAKRMCHSYLFTWSLGQLFLLATIILLLLMLWFIIAGASVALIIGTILGALVGCYLFYKYDRKSSAGKVIGFIK